MPELTSHCHQTDGRLWQLEQQLQFITGAKESKDKTSSPADRGCYDAMMYPASQAAPRKSRAKESSKHFGVRFRPDLQKWVAEIRVAEWKSVDKKVWLGTFDSEEGAARAVDAARKLLKCKKKRLPNFPCEELQRYTESIPVSLNLTNLRDDSMFKEVTLFVKRKAQEYAASFTSCTKASRATPCLSDQLIGHNLYTSDVAPRWLPPLVEAADESPSTYGDLMGEQCEWSPTSGGPLSSSSAGTSPDMRSWVLVEADDSWASLPAPLAASSSVPWDDVQMDDQVSISMDDQVSISMDDHEMCDLFFNIQDHEQAVYEMLYGADSQNNHENWVMFNNSYPLSNSFEYTQVCLR